MKQCNNENKELEKRVILDKMIYSNCITTLDALEKKYIKIPFIKVKRNENIFNVNNYVFIAKKSYCTNVFKIKINENYVYKLQKNRWIKTLPEKAFGQFLKEINRYNFILQSKYKHLFNTICENKLFNRYTLLLNYKQEVFLYDKKLNKITLADDIENYKEFLGINETEYSYIYKFIKNNKRGDIKKWKIILQQTKEKQYI